MRLLIIISYVKKGATMASKVTTVEMEMTESTTNVVFKNTMHFFVDDSVFPAQENAIVGGIQSSWSALFPSDFTLTRVSFAVTELMSLPSGKWYAGHGDWYYEWVGALAGDIVATNDRLPLGAGIYLKEQAPGDTGRPGRLVLKVPVTDVMVRPSGSRWSLEPALNTILNDWWRVGGSGVASFLNTMGSQPFIVTVSVTQDPPGMTWAEVTDLVPKWVNKYRCPRPPEV